MIFYIIINLVLQQADPQVAPLSLIENITTSLDDHTRAVGVFIDIKKASDIIDSNLFT